MASVTFPTALGGDGKTYSDDAHPDTGLDGLGHVTRFVPCLKNVIAMAGYTAQYAARIDAAAANADRAEDAKRYVEAVAESYRVNLMDAYRDRITLGADFAAGRYTLDDGVRLDTGNASEIFAVERSSPEYQEGPNGIYLQRAENEISRVWRQGISKGASLPLEDTNYALFSTELSEGYWEKTRSTITATSIASPIDGKNFFRMTEDSSSGDKRLSAIIPADFTGTAYISIFAAPVERMHLQIVPTGTGVISSNRGIFELIGNGRAEGINGAAASIQRLNGGYLCTLEVPKTAGSASFQLRMSNAFTGSLVSYQGDGSSSILITQPSVTRNNSPAIITGNSTTSTASGLIRRFISNEFYTHESLLIIDFSNFQFSQNRSLLVMSDGLGEVRCNSAGTALISASGFGALQISASLATQNRLAIRLRKGGAVSFFMNGSYIGDATAEYLIGQTFSSFSVRNCIARKLFVISGFFSDDEAKELTL